MGLKDQNQVVTIALGLIVGTSITIVGINFVLERIAHIAPTGTKMAQAKKEINEGVDDAAVEGNIDDAFKEEIKSQKKDGPPELAPLPLEKNNNRKEAMQPFMPPGFKNGPPPSINGADDPGIPPWMRDNRPPQDNYERGREREERRPTPYEQPPEYYPPYSPYDYDEEEDYFPPPPPDYFDDFQGKKDKPKSNKTVISDLSDLDEALPYINEKPDMSDIEEEIFEDDY